MLKVVKAPDSGNPADKKNNAIDAASNSNAMSTGFESGPLIDNPLGREDFSPATRRFAELGVDTPPREGRDLHSILDALDLARPADWRRRLELVEELGRLREEAVDAFSTLERLYNEDGNVVLRTGILRAIGDIGVQNPRIRDFVSTELVSGYSSHQRREAAVALGNSLDREILEYLQEALPTEPHKEVRQAIEGAIQNIELRLRGELN